jgi:hypothetical protein
MPLALTASDYAMFDGQQATTTYTQVLTAQPENNTVPIPNAVLMDPIRREIPTDGGFIYQVEREAWVPRTDLQGVLPGGGSIVPAEGDFITDINGVNWYLMADIEHNAAGIVGVGEMYRVVTRKMRKQGS